MRPNAQPIVFLLLFATLPASAQDGAVPDGGASDGGVPWVESDPFTTGDDDDPLGVGVQDQLDRVAPTPSDEVVRRTVPIRRGDVLVAIGGVSEAHHEVEVALDHGLALVTTNMRFTSRARYASEVRYRLAVPEDVSLAALEVCNVHGCREGVLDTSATALGPYDDAVRARGESSLPVAHAAPVDDDTGHALYVRAAPLGARSRQLHGVADDAWLEVRVSYLVSAPLRGGRVRLMLPARGTDNRIAPTRVRVTSRRLVGATADGVDAVERAVERAAWQTIEVSARRPRVRGGGGVESEIWTTPCGEGRCARVRAVARPSAPRPRDVIVLLDASPSTVGSARARIAPAVAALLSTLPSRSRLRIAAFAARAEPVVPAFTSPTEVSLVLVNRALERELGSATRFEAAWALVSPWVAESRNPLLLVIGDGGLTSGAAAEAAFAAAQRSRAEVAVLDVADRPTTEVLRDLLERTGGRFIDAGPEAARAAAGHGMDPLAEQIAPLLASIVEPRVRVRVGARRIDLGALRGGEEVVWEGIIDRGRVTLPGVRAHSVNAPEALSSALLDRLERASGRRSEPGRLTALAETTSDGSGVATACSSGLRPSHASGVVPATGRLVLADARHCERSPLPSVTSQPTLTPPPTLHAHTGRTGLPERSLLTMLRQRIMPAARHCFRDDRRGRASYQRRAVFEFRIADREIVDAHVVGSMAAPLRRCLTRAMDTLDIPPFQGAVSVRYPLYTSARLPPPVLTLDRDVADAVDAVSAPD